MFDTVRRPTRRGLTLVELLVVITIMMLLAAFVLPKFQLNSKTRKIREAARMINVYLGVARNRAVETGRPCGVMFQRLANQPRGAAMLFQVEVPPLYAGDTMDARVRVQYIPGAVPGSDTSFHPGGTGGGRASPTRSSVSATRSSSTARGRGTKSLGRMR